LFDDRLHLLVLARAAAEENQLPLNELVGLSSAFSLPAAMSAAWAGTPQKIVATVMVPSSAIRITTPLIVIAGHAPAIHLP
jgi:hypothetical protein